ncbi:tyrosine-type recombinase/integrase [Clostridium baratii]
MFYKKGVIKFGKGIIRNEKTAASPIPEREYIRFKYKLEELSGDNKERNMMLFYIGVATGYRMQDIVNLTIGELKEAVESGEFRIQEQKQYKSYIKHIKKNPKSKRKPPKKRVVLIKPMLKKILRKYVTNKKKSEYAFKSNKGDGYITAKSYSKILTNVAKELNIDNISGHSLRKTYITRIWDATGDLELCRRALGHKSIETTKEYLGLALEVREEAANIADSKL